MSKTTNDTILSTLTVYDLLAVETNIRQRLKVLAELDNTIVLKTYIVELFIGGTVVFDTLDGWIIEDKLCNGYIDSRKLVCMRSWNMKSIVEVTYSVTATSINVRRVGVTELQSILVMTTSKFTELCYSILYRDNNECKTISLTTSRGYYSPSMGYIEYKRLIDDGITQLTKGSIKNGEYDLILITGVA